MTVYYSGAMVRAILSSMLVFLVGAQACQTMECTAVGCADSASFQIKTADGTWSDGEYTVELVTAGITYVCTMTLPNDLPADGGGTEVPCQPHIANWGAVVLGPEVICTEDRDSNAASQSCTAVPGHYALHGTIPGTPATIGFRITRDQGLLLEQTLPVTYTETQPNGPECGPVCHQSTLLELELP